MIVVYGATGLTGRLIATALIAHGHEVRLAGRDADRLARLSRELDGLPVRTASIHDRAALERALEGAALVINCAGPFETTGAPVLATAIALGAHYLDIGGEQRFCRLAYEEFDALARRAGVVAVPSAAFEVALGDWCAHLVADAVPGEGPLDELVVAYALDELRPTAGTGSSALASLVSPGVVWEEDRWVEIAPAVHGRSFAFPVPFGARDARSFPSAEIVTVPRHLAVRRVEAFVSLGDSPLVRAGTALAALAAPLLPALLDSPLGGFVRAQIASLRTPPTAARAETRFALLVEAERDFRRARLELTGRDPYAVTSHVVVACAAALTSAAERPRPGVLAPAEAFPAARFLPRVAAAADLTLGGDAVVAPV
jgi:short subunit dehydrogenase-like uncharacterized protein